MIFSPELPADTIPLVGTFAGSSVATNQEKAQPAVSEVPQGLSDEERWFEDEMDSVIRELGQHAERAMAEGDKETAREYTRRMYAAIASRTPEHQARIEADIARRIDESTFQGEWTQEVLARAGAYFDVPAKAVRRRTLG
jgi:hypothetical protein